MVIANSGLSCVGLISFGNVKIVLRNDYFLIAGMTLESFFANPLVQLVT